MSDFLLFTEGANLIGDSGIGTGTVYFLLSTKAVGTEAAGQHKQADTLAGGVGEITGTGYARQSQKAPAMAARSKSFAQMVWLTEAHTDWPAAVKSVVLATTVDNTGKAICAWNLQAGGTARDLSGANTEEKFTPTFSL